MTAQDATRTANGLGPLDTTFTSFAAQEPRERWLDATW